MAENLPVIAAIQLNTTADVEANLQKIDSYLIAAAQAKAELVLLPENFAQMPVTEAERYRESFGQGMVQDFLAERARTLNLWLVGGSLPISSISNEQQNALPTASCLIYDNAGKCVGRYDKAHLFDVNVGDKEAYSESKSFTAGCAGNNIQIFESPIGKMGVGICYDLRFPELFRRLVKQGAEVLLVPAAFTHKTGQAHWQTLLQARAIENLCYVLAAGQTGCHANQRETWGHSMWIDPWGTILSEKNRDEGLLIGQVDLIKLRKLREQFPAINHIRSELLP